MSVDKMTVDEFSVDETSVDELTPRSRGWLNVLKESIKPNEGTRDREKWVGNLGRNKKIMNEQLTKWPAVHYTYM
jgi:hypothetical protein